jgi:hypothetical protein
MAVRRRRRRARLNVPIRKVTSVLRPAGNAGLVVREAAETVVRRRWRAWGRGRARTIVLRKHHGSRSRSTIVVIVIDVTRRRVQERAREMANTPRVSSLTSRVHRKIRNSHIS